MLELSAVHKYTAEKMRSVLVGLGWSAFEARMCIMDPVIRGVQVYHLLDKVEVKEVRSGQGKSSGLADRPTPSSDEE